jgi:deazaflavin-dependent oxidoreductase (nitroreductase family)
VNPCVRAVLRSRAHGLLSGRVLLLTVTGARSGRPFTIPVAYRVDGPDLVVRVGAPAAKRWWRNLRARPEVGLLVAGHPACGRAQVVEGPAGDVEVRIRPAPPMGSALTSWPAAPTAARSASRSASAPRAREASGSLQERRSAPAGPEGAATRPAAVVPA